jgi:hypothetical protein
LPSTAKGRVQCDLPAGKFVDTLALGLSSTVGKYYPDL